MDPQAGKVLNRIRTKHFLFSLRHSFFGLVVDIHLYRLGKAAWGSLLMSCALRRTGSWSTGSSPALPGGGHVFQNTNMSNKYLFKFFGVNSSLLSESGSSNLVFPILGPHIPDNFSYTE